MYWNMGSERNSTADLIVVDAQECAITLSTSTMSTSVVRGRLQNIVVEERAGIISQSTDRRTSHDILAWFASDVNTSDPAQIPYIPEEYPRPLSMLYTALRSQLISTINGTAIYYCPSDNNTDSIFLDQCSLDPKPDTKYLTDIGRRNQTSWTSIAAAAIGDRALNEPGGMSAVMEGIAHALTDLHYLQGNDTLLGTEFVLENRVSIQWGWVALPIVLVVLTLAALLGVILQSKGTKMRTWKSSSLPYVFASEKFQLVERKATLAKITKGTNTGLVVSDTMAEAKQTRVELRNEAKHTEMDGWRMVKVD